MAERRKREVAHRIFSVELNSAVHAEVGEDTYDPNYIITEVGSKINRVFITGVFTEKENVGSEDDPLWRARIIDPTGVFFISAGRYQPEAAKIFSELEPPQTLALSGKLRTFTSDDGRLFISIRPEVVKKIEISTRNQWILESCKSLLRRLECIKEALKLETFNEKNLLAIGYNKLEVEGIAVALRLYNYDDIDLMRYEQLVRELLVNLKEGLYDIEIMPSEEFSVSDERQNETFNGTGTESQNEDIETKENIIRTVVVDLDSNSKSGVLYEEVLDAAAKKGISKEDTEECVNVLMSKGIIFEPALGYLKSIEQ